VWLCVKTKDKLQTLDMFITNEFSELWHTKPSRDVTSHSVAPTVRADRFFTIACALALSTNYETNWNAVYCSLRLSIGCRTSFKTGFYYWMVTEPRPFALEKSNPKFAMLGKKNSRVSANIWESNCLNLRDVLILSGDACKQLQHYKVLNPV